MSEKFEYTYPVEELDQFVDKILSGIQPMMSDDLQEQVQMRYRERSGQSVDDYLAEGGNNAKVRHARIRAQIEADRRKATRKDAIVLKISEEQKKQIHEDMSASIVRKNPNSTYNKTMEQMYSDERRRSVMEKLKGLKNCYFTQADYKNAIGIIMEAIETSLGKYGNSDYPWLTYEQAVAEFNAGNIKFTYCELPKLYINYSTIMTDPEILKGVVTGDIVLKNRNEVDETYNINRKKNMTDYKPVSVDYRICNQDTNQDMINAHYAGYDTEISPYIRASSNVYNPAAMPISSRFYNPLKKKIKRPLVWDWEKPGAGKAYYDYIHGYKSKNSDIVDIVKSDNNFAISTSLSTNINDFIKYLKVNARGYQAYNYHVPNYTQPVINNENETVYNKSAAEIEKALLESISINNPSR